MNLAPFQCQIGPVQDLLPASGHVGSGQGQQWNGIRLRFRIGAIPGPPGLSPPVRRSRARRTVVRRSGGRGRRRNALHRDALRRSLGGDAPVHIKDCHRVDPPVKRAEVVLDEQDDAPRSPQFTDSGEQRPATILVDVGRGLVEDHDLRRTGHRTGDGHPLALPARQSPRILLREL